MALLAVPVLAQSIPSGWIVLKDQKKVCQIALPGDFKPDVNFVGLGKGPGDTVEAQVLSSPGAVKPLNEGIAKVMNIDKIVENTDKRVLYATKPGKGIDGRIMTGWTVKVPRDSGSCQASITVVPGGQEDLVRKIAATLGPAK
jgi:hypothetical protein